VFMKRLIWVFTVFVLLVANLAAVDYISIRDIQYTTNPGCEGTYPSQRLGEVVSTGGVVTAVEDGSGMLYLSSPQGGEWNSICVRAGKYIGQYRLRPGDRIELTGEVQERFGMTCIGAVSGMTRAGYQSSVPEVPATTGSICTDEGYEGALVRLSNVSLVRAQGSTWKVDDGSGACTMEDGFGVLLQSRMPSGSDSLWQEALGIVTFRYGEFRFNPRSASDLGSQQGLNVNQTSWGRVKSLYK